MVDIDGRERRYCPLLSGRYKNHFCIEEACAWWLRHGGSGACAVATLAAGRFVLERLQMAEQEDEDE